MLLFQLEKKNNNKIFKPITLKEEDEEKKLGQKSLVKKMTQ
jgi:hypothetical protein